MTEIIEHFYDRSRAFASVVGAQGGGPVRILLTLSPSCANMEGAQLLLLALCDILPRVSERYVFLDLDVPEVPVLVRRIPSERTLLEHLCSRLQVVCPWGTYRIVPSSNGMYDFSVVVGSTATSARAKQEMFVFSRGWRCFVTSDPSLINVEGAECNSCAVLATAALTAMKIYIEAENVASLEPADDILGWSLFDFSLSPIDGPPLPAEVDLGLVMQAGLGGTANSLLWALRFGPELSGDWRAFEHEHIDLTNGNRYLLMVLEDIGSHKTHVVEREFKQVHRRLNFWALPKRVERASTCLPEAALILATVDDPAVRIFLQWNCRGNLLNVGTASQWMSLSRHNIREIRNGAPCLACLYGDSIQLERRQRESTVSFVTALVGAVLAAEVIKVGAFPRSVLRFAWGANVFYPTAAKPYALPKRTDCETCQEVLLSERIPHV